MAELVVIRHGQASFGAENYDQLSPLGHHQAAAIGAHLRNIGWTPDRVVTGTLKRHHETLASMKIDQKNEEHSGFNEYDFHDLLNTRFGGAAPDLVMQDRKTHFRTLRETILQWQVGDVVGARESWRDFVTRVEAALTFATQSGARRTLVISSGGVIGQMVATTLSAPEPMMMELNLQVKNTAVTRFVYSAGRRMLTEFNATPHFDTQPELMSYS